MLQVRPLSEKLNAAVHALSIRFFLTTLFLIFVCNIWSQQPKPFELLDQVIKSCGEVSVLEYTMEKQERVDGEMTHQRSFIRLHRHPFKIYLKQEVPRKGLEALYAQGSNKDRILINPNGFPWINLNLATRSGLVRRDQHHTIDHSGYDYFVQILSGGLAKKSARDQAQISCSPIIDWLDEPCWKLSILNTTYHTASKLIDSKISLTKLTDSLHLCEYKIVELNKGLKAGEMIPAGSELVLPSHYGKEISIYVSTKNFLPVTFEIHDEEGIYERYDYLDVAIDPEVDDSAFMPDYSEYEF